MRNNQYLENPWKNTPVVLHSFVEQKTKSI